MKYNKLVNALVTILVAIIVIAEVIGGGSLLFFMNIFVLFGVVYKAQFSIISIWAFFPNYTLMNAYYYYKTGIAYGKLNYISNLHFDEMCIALLCYNLILLGFAYFTKFLKYEKQVYDEDFIIPRNIARVFSILAIVMAYISFPSLNFTFNNAERFNSLLPGHFWNHWAIIFLLYSISWFKNDKFVKTCFISTVIWFLLHSERVDIVGLLAFALVRYCSKKGYRFSLDVLLKVFAIISCAFVILVYVGNNRVGEKTIINVSKIIPILFTQSTASDVAHVLDGTFSYVSANGYSHGATFITYLQGLVPGIDQPLRAGHLVQMYYKTAGGELILTEPLLNFGYLGIVVLIPMYICLIKSILKKNSKYGRILFFYLAATAARYLWYGLTYIETGCVFLLPITYGILLLTKKGSTKNRVVKNIEKP